MSTKVINVGIIFLEFAILLIFSILASGTATTPIFGSMVQNGKFAASAFLDLVNALNIVDFPTLGKPTIPTLNPIKYYFYLKSYLNLVASKDEHYLIFFLLRY